MNLPGVIIDRRTKTRSGRWYLENKMAVCMARSWRVATTVGLSAMITACTTLSNALPPSGVTPTKTVHFVFPEGSSVASQTGAWLVEYDFAVY
jgi:hypothetical protein